nr:TonB-dependent receptor plug domain-containing protein [Candidatus Delongbacteria bacterium]
HNDVFKAVKFLPGVESVDPISPLYAVRGSDPGENLVLLDGVTIYNPYHFITATGLFNNYAIKNTEMLVGGFGAEYGGRNSSVLYLTTREGNNRQLHGEIEPTLSQTQFVLDFPIDSSVTMMVSGRFYYDLMTRFLLYAPSYFYDANLSLNWVINPYNRLSFRYFRSQDYMDYSFRRFSTYFNELLDTDIFDDYDLINRNRWDNQAGTAILKTIITPDLYLKTQLSGSFFSSKNQTILDFNYTDDEDDREYKIYHRTDIRNRIRDIGLKSSLSCKLNAHHTVNLGGEFNAYHLMNDMIINYFSEGSTTRDPHLAAGYIEDKISYEPVILRAGLRSSKFSYMDREYYEPRFNLTVNLPGNAKAKAAWGKYYQYIISINSQEYELSQYLDYYYPLKNQTPSTSVHYILGFEKLITDQSQLSIDFYYKDIQRVYTFDYNVNPLEAVRFSEKIKPGQGESYGMEIMWEGNFRSFSGWLSYGLSRSTRSYPHIMEGKSFVHDYDRTHTFKAVVHHQILPTLSYSGTLRVMSGTPKTLETGGQSYYYYDPVSGGYATYPTAITAKKNNIRLPLFIQLDLGLKKRIRKGFAVELADYLGASESYLTATFGNLLFLFHRNVWFYIPIEDGKYYGFANNYFPNFSVGYTIKF